jgi:hypothetical protein
MVDANDRSIGWMDMDMDRWTMEDQGTTDENVHSRVLLVENLKTGFRSRLLLDIQIQRGIE